MNRKKEARIIEKCYGRGKADSTRYNSIRDAMDRDPRLCWELTSAEQLISYQAGFEGREMPRLVIGWRYGHIPARGRSHNYADDRPEAGVSLMATDDGDEIQDRISGMFIAAKGRPKIRVEGWLNPNKRGSDGEPLIFWAKEIR